MITPEKLRIYQRYRGDIDGWARIGTPEEKAAMTDEDWYVIGELQQRLALVKRGVASENYVRKTNQMLADWVNDEAVTQALLDSVR
jgi:hypothetical protein